MKTKIKLTLKISPCDNVCTSQSYTHLLAKVQTAHDARYSAMHWNLSNNASTSRSTWDHHTFRTYPYFMIHKWDKQNFRQKVEPFTWNEHRQKLFHAYNDQFHYAKYMFSHFVINIPVCTLDTNFNFFWVYKWENLTVFLLGVWMRKPYSIFAGCMNEKT